MKARKTSDGLNRYATEINGQCGLLGFRSGEVESAVVIDTEAGRIQAVYIVVNPDKLQNLPEERNFQ